MSKRKIDFNKANWRRDWLVASWAINQNTEQEEKVHHEDYKEQDGSWQPEFGALNGKVLVFKGEIYHTFHLKDEEQNSSAEKTVLISIFLGKCNKDNLNGTL